MTTQDKQRIGKEAFELSEYASHYALYNSGIKDGYVAGATAELERSEKLIQEYREVIRELLQAIEYGELELRTTYERFTNYKGSSSLWAMQEAFEKHKSLIEPKTDKA